MRKDPRAPTVVLFALWDLSGAMSILDGAASITIERDVQVPEVHLITLRPESVK